MTFFSNMLSATVEAAPAAAFHAPAGAHGHERIVRSEFTITTAESVLAEAADPVIAMIRLPWSARLMSLVLDNTDMATTTWTVATGIYASSISGEDPVIVDVDAFDVTVDLGSAQEGLDSFSQAAHTWENRGDTLWELAGLAAHPNDGTDAVICLTSLVITAALAGTAVLTAKYLENA